MKRRKFIRNSLSASVAPVFIPGFKHFGLGASVLSANDCADFSNRSLVIIYLAGANDIFNTAVPLDQLSTYHDPNIRGNISLPDASLITLDTTLPDNQQLGLHPNLTGFKSLYDQGKFKLIQRAGYPIPNRSHFTAEDIMLKGIYGDNSTFGEEEGWMARFLKDRYPTYRGRPLPGLSDPLGIILGDTPKTGFHTVEDHSLEINLSGQDAGGFYSLISSISGAPILQFPNTDHGELLSYMSLVEKSTLVYSERISQVFNTNNYEGNSTATYPSSTLGSQLKTVARLMYGGSDTKIFMCRKGGWDTHANQVDPNNTIIGSHATLLKDVNDSMLAFQNDLKDLGLEDNVTTVVFSEFGRKVISNAGSGTDHGTFSTMFVMGNSIVPGVLGSNIDMSHIDSQGAADPSQLENDYRNIFGSVLQDWLGADAQSVGLTFNNAANQLPQIISSTETVTPDCYYERIDPVTAELNIKLFLEGYYQSSDGMMRTDLLDSNLLPNAQPYGASRFSYFGTETTPSFPANTVDWLLLELRDIDDLVVDRKACLLRNDGMVMELDGSVNVQFADLHPTNYSLVIYHRSHLSVMVSNQFDSSLAGVILIDITTDASKVVGTNQLKNVDGVYMMYAGDVDQNGVINNLDHNSWKRSISASQTYKTGDLNADGLVDDLDKELWISNRSKIGESRIHPTIKK